MSLKLDWVSFNDRHASHRNCFRLMPGIHQKRSVAFKSAWTEDYHVWGAMLEACHKLHPKPKSITELTEKRCRSGTACRRDRSTRLFKASHWDWRKRWAMSVNSSSKKFWSNNRKSFQCVVSVTLCFGANVSRRAKIAKWCLPVLHNNQQTSSWSITLMVVVGHGMRHATGAELANWALNAAGFSCSTTTAGSWFQSLTVLTANEVSKMPLLYTSLLVISPQMVDNKQYEKKNKNKQK